MTRGYLVKALDAAMQMVVSVVFGDAERLAINRKLSFGNAVRDTSTDSTEVCRISLVSVGQK